MKKDGKEGNTLVEKNKNTQGRGGVIPPTGAIPPSTESEEGGVIPPLGVIPPSDPSGEIARFTSELEAKTKEAADNYERFLRACADVENYKKRAERERSDCVNFANETLISEVLPVIDNLERALEHAGADMPPEGAIPPVGGLAPAVGGISPERGIPPEGVRLTINQFYAVMKKFGLEEIKAVGERFDPVMHHAISHEETDETDEGMVVREFQKGYILKGRLLRASMVAVAKKPVKAAVH